MQLTQKNIFDAFCCRNKFALRGTIDCTCNTPVDTKYPLFVLLDTMIGNGEKSAADVQGSVHEAANCTSGDGPAGSSSGMRKRSMESAATDIEQERKRHHGLASTERKRKRQELEGADAVDTSGKRVQVASSTLPTETEGKGGSDTAVASEVSAFGGQVGQRCTVPESTHGQHLDSDLTELWNVNVHDDDAVALALAHGTSRVRERGATVGSGTLTTKGPCISEGDVPAVTGADISGQIAAVDDGVQPKRPHVVAEVEECHASEAAGSADDLSGCEEEDRKGLAGEESSTSESTESLTPIEDLCSNGGKYKSLAAARDAVHTFQNRTKSRLLDKGNIVSGATHGKTVYRCRAGVRCPVKVYLHAKQDAETVVTVSACMVHNHELQRPQRISHHEKEKYLSQYHKRVAEDKLPRQHAYNKTNLEHQEQLSASYTTRQCSRMVRLRDRQREEAQLQELAGDMEAGVYVEGEDGEQYVRVAKENTPLNAAAVLGRLRRLRTRDVGSYVYVHVDNGVLTFMICCTSQMRRNGSLFGELWLVDDKHKCSKDNYKVPTLTVMTNSGHAVPAAVGFFAHGDKESWERFLEHAHKAFVTVSGSPARPLKCVIADQDGCIMHAVLALGWESELGVQLWRCWFHWKRHLRTLFPKLKATLDHLCIVFERLLTTNEWWAYECLQAQARETILSLPVGDGRKVGAREHANSMLEEIVANRQLAKIPFFTNGYTSQSPAESMNNVWRLNGVNAGRQMGHVVDAILDYCENRGVVQADAEDKWDVPQGPVSAEETARVLTPSAYEDLFLPQWRVASTLEVTDSGSIFQMRKPGGTGAEMHVVTRLPDMTCTCNYRKYRGMICGHMIRAVGMSNGGTYRHEPALFDDRWCRQQSKVEFKFSSPEVPSVAEVKAVLDDGGEDEGL
eukprot:GHVU01170521.1.p1 GENE.GHVU01170521.1~~GHVU01170521.1.p1  ORF type:complete len:909 (-),score=133.40 GHVU01170521.1:2234-4960(-)